MHTIGRELAGHQQRIEGSPARCQRQVPIIYDGEKCEKKKESETSAMCTKSAEVRQMVGSVPVDRWRLVTEALPTFQKLKNSAD